MAGSLEEAFSRSDNFLKLMRLFASSAAANVASCRISRELVCEKRSPPAMIIRTAFRTYWWKMRDTADAGDLSSHDALSRLWDGQFLLHSNV